MDEINLFFRIQIADADYKKAFEDELIAFKDRIRRRAQVPTTSNILKSSRFKYKMFCFNKL
jgi:hypothetical protein